ncbi:APC family permease [Nesterenkonia aerolata]|uniref:APC family permease n=1 Tax=Nesterenkonia aerolata TaxID=3074079 RepID=A0ABU2DR78_9MICC|nr:APC family permease [Nesterenkonia sp. LY-0111]MDR8018921.1 APC family permease [Nesterenkonia sp. LY-0111]
MKEPIMSTGKTVPGNQPDAPAHATRLAKNLKPHWVWAIALGSAVGWGAFVLPADWMDTAGPLGALLGLAIGGALMIVVGVSYGFLAKVFPVSGGAFAYTLVGFGRTHAYICAWFMTLGYVSIVALNASALGLLAKRVVPQIAEIGYLYTIAEWDVYLGEVLIATAALVIFAVINIGGGGNSARLQFYMCLLMLGAVAVIFVGVLASPQGQASNMEPLFSPDTAAVAGVLAIVAIAPWAFIGFDNIPQTAEEFSFSASKAFRLIVWSLIAATLLYLAMIVATAAGAPWQDELAEQPLWLTADVVSGALGPIGLVLLCLAAFMGIATGLNGFYVAGSRVLLAMGRAQMIPSAFARVHPKHGTPSVGIWFVLAVCLIAPWFGRTALSWIVDMASIGFTFAFAYTCLCAYRMFRWSGQPEDVEGAASTPRKLAAAAGVVVALIFTVLLLAPGSPAQLTMPSFVAMGAWILIGVLFFISRRRHLKNVSEDEIDTAVLGAPRPQWLRGG